MCCGVPVCGHALWKTAAIQYCCWKHMCCTAKPWCFSVIYVNHVWRMINRTTPSIPCMIMMMAPLNQHHCPTHTSILQSVFSNTNISPASLVQLSNQWEVTRGTWLKVNVCRGKHVITYKDAKGKKLLLDSCLVTKLKFYKMFSVFNLFSPVFFPCYRSNNIVCKLKSCLNALLSFNL